MIAGLVATSPKDIAVAAQAHEDLVLSAHLAANDEAQALEAMSFLDLEELRDELTFGEPCDWNTVADIDYELRTRKQDAVESLQRLFLMAVDVPGSALPIVDFGDVVQMPVADYLREEFNCVGSVDWSVDLALGKRAEVMALMSVEYGSADRAEEILRAGWAA